MSVRTAVSLLFMAAYAASAEPPSFNRDVRPILSEHCYRCHGPDAAKREADLRLDLPPAPDAETVFVGEGDALPPLIARITSTDPNEMMPPPEAKLELDAGQIDVLKQWLEAGAGYERHWAFDPPARRDPPAVDNQDWVRNPIDAFVLQRLEREGIAPSPEADRNTLLRRAAFDLTGLPTTIEDLDRFGGGEYERAVDRFLNSTAYGERMAADWLDVARYADTYGYQSDRDNRVWPWREWVIRAFNNNMPYDQFVEEQLAGDLLPNPSQDQILATAFNRLHRQTNEGGSVLEEWRVEYVADRTTTYGTALLGMTLECARCHDHKFDPISQENFYELSAFFNNIDESGMYSHFTDPTPSPALMLYDNASREAHHMLRMRVEEREHAVERAADAATARFKQWLGEQMKEGAVTIAAPESVFGLRFDDEEAITAIDSELEGVSAKLTGGPNTVEHQPGRAIQFSGDNGLEIHKAGAFDRADPFSFALWLKPSSTDKRAVVFHRSKAAEDAASRGYEMLIEDGRIEFALCHFWPGNAIRVRGNDEIAAGQWAHVAVTYDGSSRADGVRLFMNGERVETDVIRDNLYKTILYEGDEGPPIIIGSRFRDSGFIDGIVDDFLGFNRQLSTCEIHAIHGTQGFVLRETSDEQLLEYYLLNVDEEVRAQRDSLQAVRREEAAFSTGIREIMAMTEMDEPRQAYFLERGHYANRAQPVGPNTPEGIMPFPETLPRNRLGLAKWTTDPANPLTARVAVNRIWRLFFGAGLVETQEDFGLQGRPPTHPELLDYLATWFVDNDWDVKGLCKLIAKSATYRQSSAFRPDLAERDPANVLLARGPQYRLSAEQIRDAALAASGLLVSRIGGPSVRPYQPAGLWKDAGSLTYKADEGDGLYRRSMYTFWKRTVPPPDMLTFDAPTRETCVARREETVTPLQVLVLLNSEQFVEAARALAEEVVNNGGETSDQITETVRRLLGRHPSKEELNLLTDLYQEQQRFFAKNTEAAAEFINIGASEPGESIPIPQLAAMATVVQAVMNHDEFIMKM